MPNIPEERSTESESLLIQYFNVLKKRYAVLLSFSGALALSAVIATVFSTRYYAAKAVIEIMPIAPNIMGKDSSEAVTELGVASDSSLRVYYGTQFAILSSDTVLGKAVQRLRVDHGVTDFDIFSDEKDQVAFLRQNMRLLPQPETSLVHVRVEYPDPKKAEIFANVIANVYMENNLDRNLIAVKKALSWLEREHERYREAKLSSDQKVHDFKYENHLVGIEQRSTATDDKLNALGSALNDIQSKRLQINAEYTERLRILKSESWTALSKEFSLNDRVMQQMLSNRALLLQQQDELYGIRYTEKHPKLIALDRQIDQINLRIRLEVEKHVASKHAELEIVLAKENAVKKELSLMESQAKELDKKLIELQFLLGEAERNEKLYKAIDNRLSEVDLSQFLQSNNIRFVDRAVASDVPVRPSLTMNLVMALLLGLLGGAGLAFLVEYLDNTVKTKEDLEALLGVPLLGVVPVIDPETLLQIASNRERSLFAHTMPRSNVSESLRSIRTNVLFRTGTQKTRTILVTSAVPREGKSFMSSNLSAVIAMAGSRVIIIDADLRRPSVHRLFEMSDAFGLSDILMGQRTIEDCIQRSHIPGLDVISAGPIPQNPSELLGSPIMRQIKERLSEQYDVIVIDSPPATAVADPMILSPMADGVILVVEANQTRKPVVMQAVTRLRQVQANLLGGIVNKLDLRKAGYGYYYYYYSDYGYYADDEYESRQLG